MGIPIMPGPDYSNECPLCFAEGMTPNAVICSLSGIRIGDAWEPGFLNPPNRMIVLNKGENCNYLGFYTEKGQNMLCRWWAGVASLIVTVGIAIPVFMAHEDPCSTFFTNSGVDPDLMYYGGSAVIMCSKTFSPTSESQHIAELIGVPKDEHTKFDFWPISETRMCVRIARYKKQANALIIIKRDEI